MLSPIISYDLFAPDLITESDKRNADGRRNIIMTGILQRADTLNQNGRVYPKHILEREVKNYQKLIAENRSCGECDHPNTSVVELQNVSHIIREAVMDGSIVRGKVEILPTPKGEILRVLVENNVKLGISSRGVGSTHDAGDHQIVQDDFQLICWDFVSEPSTPGAFMMAEGKQHITQNDLKNIFSKSDRVNRAINELLLKYNTNGKKL